MTDESTEVDPFGDDLFNNGASGSGLDEFENKPILIIPTEWTKGGFTDSTGKAVDVVDATVISFGEGTPEVVEAVRIFAGALVGGLKRNALFNAQHDVNPSTGLPKMTIGKLYKGPKSAGKAQPWKLDPITDKAMISRMASYARANLKSQDPFTPLT